MKGTTITLFGGVARIGGNCALIEESNSLALLDLGKDFQQYRRYFEFPFNLPSRSVRGELIKTEALPSVRSVRDGTLPLYVDLEDGNVSEPKESSPLREVLLSHSHSDHSGFLSILRSDVKVRLGAMTHVIYSSVMETRRETSLETKLYWKGPQHSHEKQPRLSFSDFYSSSRIQMGDMEVTPHPVDHSVPGAYAFSIDTKSARLAYTGDLRMHGPAKQLTASFVETLEADPVDVLVCEGTNMNVGRVGSEQQVEADALALVGRNLERGNRLVIVEVRSTDIDRINTFNRVGQKLDCGIVVTTRLAHLLYRIEKAGLAKRLKFGIPELRKDLKVLVEASGRLEWWEKEVIESPGIQTADDEILRKPKHRVMVLDSGRFNVFRTTPPPGTLYIESVSEHVDEEEEYGEERFVNSLALHGVVVYRLHSSGHASPEDLIELVRRAKPKKLVPMHTEHPEAFYELFRDFCQVILPEKGVPIAV